MNELQEKIISFLKGCHNQTAPPLAIAKGVGLGTTKDVNKHLYDMEKADFVEKLSDRPNGSNPQWRLKNLPGNTKCAGADITSVSLGTSAAAAVGIGSPAAMKTVSQQLSADAIAEGISNMQLSEGLQSSALQTVSSASPHTEDRTSFDPQLAELLNSIDALLRECLSFLSEKTLKQKLKDCSISQQAEVLEFLTALGQHSYMQIKVREIEDLDKVISEIEQYKDGNWYCVRRQPHAGLAVLIGNTYFQDKDPRDGTECDLQNLKRLFQQLNFEVQEHKDLTAAEIKSTVAQLSKKTEFSLYDVFILVVLSHGEQGRIYGTDGESVSIDEMVDKFNSRDCKGLSGKPKLFLIQACQGNSDSVVSDAMSDDSDSYKPSLRRSRHLDGHEKADTLIAYAACKGYRAWRHAELGSFFVRALVYVIAKFAHEKHALDLLTKTNNFLSFLSIKMRTGPEINLCIKSDSTFLKNLYLFPGYNGTHFN